MPQSTTKKRRLIDENIYWLIQDPPIGLTPGDIATLRLGLEKMSAEANEILRNSLRHNPHPSRKNNNE